MKKLLLVALIGFSLTSCKKDYVCDCTFSTSNINPSGGMVTVNSTKVSIM